MFFKAVAARNFRNLEEFRMELCPRFNVIEGQNAHGKTNLLELLHLFGTTRSFRTQRLGDVRHFDAESSTALADLTDGSRVRFEIVNNRRKIWVDENYVKRVSDYVGTVKTLLFAPEDVHLFRGSPSPRRSWLDGAIFTSRASYIEVAQKFGDVLKQRNACLKDERFDRTLYEVYTEEFVRLSAEMVAARLEYLDLLRPYFKTAFTGIFGEGVEADLTYTSKWLPEAESHGVASARRLEEADIAEALAEDLNRLAHAERHRGSTLAGPQRDDVTALVAGIPAERHASQGQNRSLVLATRVAEILLLRDKFDIRPVLLLDDVSSELDASRNERLFSFLAEFTGQVVISTTSQDYIRLPLEVRTDHTAVWQMSSGVLTPRSEAAPPPGPAAAPPRGPDAVPPPGSDADSPQE